MGIQLQQLHDSPLSSPAKQPLSATPPGNGGAPRLEQLMRNKEIVDPAVDHVSWHVNSRVISGGAGRGSGCESFFPMRPSYVCLRPEPYTILHLRSDGQSRWSSPLPHNFSSLDLRLSSSKSFNDEAGTRYGGYMRGDIQDGITRDDFDISVSGRSPADGPVEIVHTSVTPQGVRITFEYVFEHAGESEGWLLMDVVVVIKGVAARL